MTERQCPYCLAAFTPAPPQQRAVYCDAVCQAAAQRERRREERLIAAANRRRAPSDGGLLGPQVTAAGGGTMPSLRTTYPAAVRAALHALAESNPDPLTYARERERILGGA
jgi:hypothetical protein